KFQKREESKVHTQKSQDQRQERSIKQGVQGLTHLLILPLSSTKIKEMRHKKRSLEVYFLLIFELLSLTLYVGVFDLQ
ncbi:hypothetical protein LINPERHAP1_LOCUS32946, partial [Linum perenne]